MKRETERDTLTCILSSLIFSHFSFVPLLNLMPSRRMFLSFSSCIVNCIGVFSYTKCCSKFSFFTCAWPHTMPYSLGFSCVFS